MVNNSLKQNPQDGFAKVPEITLIFWIIKVAATTLGETGGDAVTMSLGAGYLIGTAIFGAIFLITVFLQIKSSTFHPSLYWITIVATTTVGTTLADFADRSLGLGYTGGTTILFCLLMTFLTLWYFVLGSVSVNTVHSPKQEIFYWVTIMLSQTLGTALGDWMADSTGLGYGFAVIVFGGAIAILACIYNWTNVSRTGLFWAAFILTRPLGAVLGDLLDKPLNAGGLGFSRFTASFILIIFIVLSIRFFPQKPSRRPGTS